MDSHPSVPDGGEVLVVLYTRKSSVSFLAESLTFLENEGFAKMAMREAVIRLRQADEQVRAV